MLNNPAALSGLASAIADKLSSQSSPSSPAEAKAQMISTWTNIMSEVMNYIVANSVVQVNVPPVGLINPYGGSTMPGAGTGTIS